MAACPCRLTGFDVTPHTLDAKSFEVLPARYMALWARNTGSHNREAVLSL